MSGPEVDAGVIALAHEVFDLARNGAAEALGDAVDAGVPVNLTNDKGDALLMLAAYHNHPDTVAVLLARGADTSRVNDRGQTALAAAVFRRSPASVTALLDAGADPTLGSPSALDMAGFFELPDMLELLTSRLPPPPDPTAEVVEVGAAGIRLGQLLKLAGVVDSGGAVKELLEAGGVLVNGRPESRRGAQLQPGDTVATGGRLLRLLA